MARRCKWCNRIITDDKRIISRSTIEMLKEEYGLEEDPEETSALPMCIDCLESLGKHDGDS